jgi:hypothetical protein
MFIEYGVNEHGELIYIDQVPRGQTNLHCPYCGGLLLARKGQIKAPHFAHAGETCRQAERDQDAISLPIYDNFNLRLPGRAVKELHNYANNSGEYNEDYLATHELIEWNDFKGRSGGYDLTKKGKIVLGQLSLMLFCDFQEPLVLERHKQLQDTAKALYIRSQIEPEIDRLKAERDALPKAPNNDYNEWKEYPRFVELNKQISRLQAAIPPIYAPGLDLETALIDLRLYRAQWRRILSTSLYFLEITHAAGTLYKIGVTTRQINQRIQELAADLAPHFAAVKITPLGVWPHRGNVEFYFKHHYQAHCTPLGSLTEYYTFEDAKPVLRDLRRMKTKELTDLERQILDGLPPEIETVIRRDEIETKRRAGIRRGLAKAKRRGTHIGRPAQSTDNLLVKYPAVVEALRANMSLREAANHAGVAVNTVRKVKDALDV